MTLDIERLCVHVKKLKTIAKEGHTAFATKIVSVHLDLLSTEISTNARILKLNTSHLVLPEDNLSSSTNRPVVGTIYYLTTIYNSQVRRNFPDRYHFPGPNPSRLFMQR